MTDFKFHCATSACGGSYTFSTNHERQFQFPTNPAEDIWKICIDLRLFSKCLVEPFLRSLRLNFKIWPQNFLAQFEKSAANFKNVRQTCVSQTVPKLLFICLFYSSSKRPFYWNAKGGMNQSNKSEIYLTFSRVRANFSELPKIFRGQNQIYTNRVLQTIQMKLIILCVWAEPAVLGSTKTALKFKHEI